MGRGEGVREPLVISAAAGVSPLAEALGALQGALDQLDHHSTCEVWRSMGSWCGDDCSMDTLIYELYQWEARERGQPARESELSPAQIIRRGLAFLIDAPCASTRRCGNEYGDIDQCTCGARSEADRALEAVRDLMRG